MVTMRRLGWVWCLGAIACSPQKITTNAPVAAGPPLSRECEQAARQHERARELQAAGKVLRALRVIEQADARCPAQRARSSVRRLELLAEVGRVDQARELARELEASASVTDDERRRVQEASALLGERRSEEAALRENGAPALESRLRSLAQRGDELVKAGRPEEGQRFLDRALDSLERLGDARVEVRVRKSFGYTLAVAWSSDGQRLAFGDVARVFVLDRSTGRPRQVAEGDSFILSLAYRPGAHELVAGSMDGSLAVMPEDGTPRRARRHSTALNALAYSPDGAWLASASDDTTICVGPPGSLDDCTFTLRGHHDRVLALVFSRDGRRLLSGDNDGRLIGWDLVSRQELFRQRLPHGSIRALAASPDGKYIAAGADRTVLLDALNGEVVRASAPTEAPVVGLAWSHVGDRLFMGAKEHSLRAMPIDCALGPCPERTLVRWPAPGEVVSEDICVKAELPFGWEMLGPFRCLNPHWLARAGQTDGAMTMAMAPGGEMLAAASGGTGVWLSPIHALSLPWSMTLTPVGTGAALVAATADGYLERASAEDEEALRCSLHELDFPFALCRERALVPDLLARTLRGDLSYRDP